MSSEIERIKKTRRAHFEDGTSFKGGLLEVDLESFRSPGQNGVRLQAGGVPLCYDGTHVYVDPLDSHTVVIGSTGSKKTRLSAMPTVCSLGLAGESMIVSDPKGEIFDRCGEFLKGCGYNVQTIDFRIPASSDGWNPLSRPLYHYLRGDVSRCHQMVNDIASIFMSLNQTSKDPFWDNAAGSLFIGLCLLLMNLCQRYGLADDTVNLSNVYQLRELLFQRQRGSDNDVHTWLWDVVRELPEIYSYLGIADTAAEKTDASILSTFDSKMILFRVDPDTVDLLSRDDVSIEQLSQNPGAVFLIYPDEKSTYNAIVSLFVKQSYECLISEAYSSDGGALHNRVNYVLDEFSSLPAICDFPAMITAGRSRRIRFDLFIQSEHQLKLRYGEEADTIMSNCVNWIMLRTRDLDLLRKVSLLCGEYEWDGTRKEVLSISDLQRLEKEDGEAVVLSGNRRPFITNLADIELLGVACVGIPPKRSDSITSLLERRPLGDLLGEHLYHERRARSAPTMAPVQNDSAHSKTDEVVSEEYRKELLAKFDELFGTIDENCTE